MGKWLDRTVSKLMGADVPGGAAGPGSAGELHHFLATCGRIRPQEPSVGLSPSLAGCSGTCSLGMVPLVTNAPTYEGDAEACAWICRVGTRVGRQL